MANIWMHNGFLQVEGEKMSKSLGNFVTINELLETDVFGGRKWPGEVLRLAMLKTHYRQPIDWTVKALEEAEKELDQWYRVLDQYGYQDVEPDVDVISALADDLNTSAAITRLRALARFAFGVAVNEPLVNLEKFGGSIGASLLRASAQVLGLLNQTPAEWNAAKQSGDDIDTIFVESLIAARLDARRAKNFAESDRLRDELAAMGIALKDGKDPATGEPTTSWEVKR